MKLPAQIYEAVDNPDGGIYLRTAYDPEFLTEFKAGVPSSDRVWDATDREWWVSEQYDKKAIRIASQYFNLEYCD